MRSYKASYMHCNPSQEAAPFSAAPSASGAVRVRGLAMVIGCAAVLAAAWFFIPRSRGYGTHEQLGIPACTFLGETGYPCPSCGMTTSVSAAARGRIALAWRAHPFGAALLAWIVVLGLVGAAELAGGRSVVHRLRPGWWWLWAGVGGLLAGWVWVLVAGTLDGRWGL